MWRRALSLVGGVLVVTAAAAIVWLVPRSGGTMPPPAALPAALPAPVVPAFAPGKPRPLGPGRSQWAVVRHAVTARERPGRHAPAVARVHTRTPEGTPGVVAVLGHRARAGMTWVRVSLPVLPNGTTGWVPRRALGVYETVRTRFDVDLRRLRATLLRDGRPVLRMRVGVGRPGWPTPTGRFYVRNRLTRFRSPAYGPIAFGTSARSPRATDWPAGGFVGIHGTDRPDLIPGRVSHGCIRLRNADIRALARVMPVGTPVTVH